MMLSSCYQYNVSVSLIIPMPKIGNDNVVFIEIAFFCVEMAGVTLTETPDLGIAFYHLPMDFIMFVFEIRRFGNTDNVAVIIAAELA